MDLEHFELERRVFLKKLLAIGVGSVGTSMLTRHVLAMGESGQLLEGVRKMQGSILINGAMAQVNSIVSPGDVVSTGSGSLGVFVIGSDAFLVRENSQIELLGETASRGQDATKTVKTIKVVAGKVLSVFGKGEKHVETSNAVVGVRGTGLYVEEAADVTYVCLCYGEAVISSLAYPSAREAVVTKHHDHPLYVLANCAGRPFLRAPVINHTDEELIMLEALVGRKPPFAVNRGSSTSAY
ncbi:MAG TPA: FecR domain-containing protein [Nitrospirota bacterium]|nr:FecR domain-containing protein [Nitrospirota bacterium]